MQHDAAVPGGFLLLVHSWSIAAFDTGLICYLFRSNFIAVLRIWMSKYRCGSQPNIIFKQ